MAQTLTTGTDTVRHDADDVGFPGARLARVGGFGDAESAAGVEAGTQPGDEAR